MDSSLFDADLAQFGTFVPGGGAAGGGLQFNAPELNFGMGDLEDQYDSSAGLALDNAYDRLMPSLDSPMAGGGLANAGNNAGGAAQDFFAGEKRKVLEVGYSNSSAQHGRSLLGSLSPSKMGRYDGLDSADDDIIVTSGASNFFHPYGFAAGSSSAHLNQFAPAAWQQHVAAPSSSSTAAAGAASSSSAFSSSSAMASLGVPVPAAVLTSRAASAGRSLTSTVLTSSSASSSSRALSTISEESDRSTATTAGGSRGGGGAGGEASRAGGHASPGAGAGAGAGEDEHLSSGAGSSRLEEASEEEDEDEEEGQEDEDGDEELEHGSGEAGAGAGAGAGAAAPTVRQRRQSARAAAGGAGLEDGHARRPASASASAGGGAGGSGDPEEDHMLVVLPRPLAAALGRKGRLPFAVAYPRGYLATGSPYSVGVYGADNGQRAARLAAFNDLRARRIFYKKVKYGQRHVLANGRQRVKGRFVKDGEPGAAPPVAGAAGGGGKAGGSGK